MGELVGGIMSKASVMADAIKWIMSGNVESLTKKRQHQIKSITENLAMLCQEKRMLINMGLLTVDIDDQIQSCCKSAAPSEPIISLYKTT